MLFLMFTAGAVVALVYIVGGVPGGVSEVVATGAAANKFQFFNFSLDPTLEFTFWVGITLSVWGSLYSYGTDQMLAQRMFCCRGVSPARWSIISSSISQLVPATCLFIGVALYAYFKHHPMTPDEAAQVAQSRDRIFPLFIVGHMPAGVRGMIIAAIFAAAIPASSLAAMAQTFMTAFWQPFRRRRAGLRPGEPDPPEHERFDMVLSRILIVVSGIALSAMAYVGFAAKIRYPEVLNLALSMVGYTGGGLLAAFLLAFLKVDVDDRGILWSVPLSMVAVFGMQWKQPWAGWVVYSACVLLLVLWFALQRPTLSKTLIFIMGLAVAVSIYLKLGVRRDGQLLPFSWPYMIPTGSVIAFLWGWMLGDRVERIPGQNPTVGPEKLKLGDLK